MNGQLIKFESLPSKGKMYPNDIEIYVKPLTVREQIDMDRYGISQAEYFQKVLDGIVIQGMFNKDDLFFYDVQFIDLVRRLYTFDIEDKISITNYPCSNPYCNEELTHEFMFNEIQFTDFPEDIFNKTFTFSDGLEVVVSPITVSEFIRLCKKYLTNKKGQEESESVLAYYIYCIKEVKDREFKNREKRDEFLLDYLGSLTKNKDTKILKQIEKETSSNIVPFSVICPQCGEITEVGLFPSANFQQEDRDV